MFKLFSDVKFYLAILAVAVVVFGYVNLPQRVDKAEEAIGQNEGSISKVAHTFDMYMMEQRTIQTQQDKREELMLELIRDK